MGEQALNNSATVLSSGLIYILRPGMNAEQGAQLQGGYCRCATLTRRFVSAGWSNHQRLKEEERTLRQTLQVSRVPCTSDVGQQTERQHSLSTLREKLEVTGAGERLFRDGFLCHTCRSKWHCNSDGSTLHAPICQTPPWHVQAFEEAAGHDATP